MATVATARGAIAADELGHTLMHEHVFVLTPELEQNYDLAWNEEERVADAVERLNELKAAGIDTIVDLTVVGLGRYIPRIERIAQSTALYIVVATGLYTYNDLPHYFNYKSADHIADLFVRDITEGVRDTSVKAAILKCATDEQGVTPGVERILRAVAQAHRRTGAPISTHTHAASRRGLDQQKIFLEEGVDLGRVVIGHSGDTTDLDYLEELMAAGSYIGMDRFGIDMFLPFEQRVDTVAALCRRGRADRMVLSHDAACHMDWFDAAAIKSVAPNWHFLHISHDVLPALRARGVTEAQITQMLVANPRNIFENTQPY